jgi:hypothetical protein
MDHYFPELRANLMALVVVEYAWAICTLCMHLSVYHYGSVCKHDKHVLGCCTRRISKWWKMAKPCIISKLWWLEFCKTHNLWSSIRRHQEEDSKKGTSWHYRFVILINLLSRIFKLIQHLLHWRRAKCWPYKWKLMIEILISCF